MLSNITPLNGRVLVKTEPRESGGLRVNIGREKNRIAVVLRMPERITVKRGKKWIDLEPEFKAGDRVWLEKLGHPEGGRSYSEPYSDEGMRMIVPYEWIGGVVE